MPSLVSSKRQACKTPKAWYTWKISGATMGIIRCRGSTPQRRQQPLCVVVSAVVFAVKEDRDVLDTVPGKAMALDVVTASGTITGINVHAPRSSGDSWASKASFWVEGAMHAAAKTSRRTRPVLIGGDFNIWLESPGRPGTKRFMALWEQCGSMRAGHSAEEDLQPTREGHRLDSYLLNAPLNPWAMRERTVPCTGETSHGARV